MATKAPLGDHLCFLIGPIGKAGTVERKHADLLLHLLVKHVLEREEFAYKVKRADEDADPGMIGDRIISDIINARLVVADLTDLNPNAFYELGIRHSTELPTIHIAKAGTPLPFDNIAHRTIFVDLSDWKSIEEAREQLANSARAINAPGYKVSNPITQANASFTMRQSSDPRDQLLAEMQERMAAFENAIASSTAQNAPPLEASHVATAINDDLFSVLVAMKRGETLDAIKKYQAATGSGLKTAKQFIEHILNQQKIEAIKIHRQVTGWSLKPSMDYVDAIQATVMAREQR